MYITTNGNCYVHSKVELDTFTEEFINKNKVNIPQYTFT